ncbi:MAG: glycosyltransferase family 39 protein [bacterium]
MGTQAARALTTGLLIALLVAAGTALRLYRLDTLPPRLAADEYTTALDVFEILHGSGPALFGLDWKPMPALTAHASAALMHATGPSILGLRLLSIVLSILAGVLLFIVLRWTCAPAVAWAAALALLADPWFLNFSRSNWENGHVAAYWLLFTWCFFSALRARRRMVWYGLAGGAALALSCYGYFSGRLLLIAWLLYAPLAAAASGATRQRVRHVYALIGVTAAILFAPQVPVIVQQWDYFQQRVRNVSVFSAAADGEAGSQGSSSAALIAAQLGVTLRYLTIGAPLGKCHYAPSDRPPYHLALVPLLLIGLVAGARRWRDGTWWWLLLAVPLIATQGLSIDAPDLARLVVAAPVFFWFIGFGAQTLLDRLPERRRGQAGLALACGSALLAVIEWRYFVGWMSSPAVAVARGGGVDTNEFATWQALQYRRMAAGRRPVPVVEWERREVHDALLAGDDDAVP